MASQAKEALGAEHVGVGAVADRSYYNSPEILAASKPIGRCYFLAPDAFYPGPLLRLLLLLRRHLRPPRRPLVCTPRLPADSGLAGVGRPTLRQ